MMEREQERRAKSASSLVVFMHATTHVNLTSLRLSRSHLSKKQQDKLRYTAPRLQLMKFDVDQVAQVVREFVQY
jgi:hypothetical protein